MKSIVSDGRQGADAVAAGPEKCEKSTFSPKSTKKMIPSPSYFPIYPPEVPAQREWCFSKNSCRYARENVEIPP